MKFMDKVLRLWRTRVALRYVTQSPSRVLDIGCDDGYLLKQLPACVVLKNGLDPRLTENSDSAGVELFKGHFPDDRSVLGERSEYDAVFALAVFEHFSTSDLVDSSGIMPSLLAPGGRLIVTVPHPLVDRILDVLVAVRLLEGRALEEHHGFDPADVVAYFGQSLELIVHKRFQFGMNNIFVFGKVQ